MMNTYALNIASSLALALASSPLGESAADKAKRLQLEGFRNHDFHLLLVMTALVAIGVIMEGPEIVHEARNAWLQCRGRRVRHRSIAPWITLIGALGWLFVAVGVAGEGYWEVQVSHDDEAITSFDEQKLGDAERDAGNANERAGKAEERAAKLLAEIQPRRLTAEQERAIGVALKGYAGKTVSVATYRDDAEAMILGIQVAESLTQGKILAQNRLGTFDAVGLPLFLGVIVDTNSSNKKLEHALFKSLKMQGGVTVAETAFCIGEGSTMYIPAHTNPDDAFIFIGEKPIAEETWQNNAKPTSNPCAKR